MENSINPTGIAIIGCGTVGGGTALLLHNDRDFLSKRSGCKVNLTYVADMNLSHARSIGLPESLLTEDSSKAINDVRTGIVIELIGGLKAAKSIIEQALKAGKHVITANKALVAHHGKELFALARANNVSLSFEASCAGGIPIVRTLCDGLIANQIDAIYGIVNGTCNFILSEMTEKGKSYDDVLKQAQDDGLAEADPTLDVSGHDSAHKIAIMSSLAFGKSVDYHKIQVTGIDKLNLFDISTGTDLGYIIKLIAQAKKTDSGISLRVHPAFIEEHHPLARVSGPFNAISVYGHAVGHTMYYGRGAGDMPTASAVVSDVIAVLRGQAQAMFNELGFWPDQTEPAVQLDPQDEISRFYLRFNVEDKCGVVEQIASILSSHGISISSLLQKDFKEGKKDSVPLVITTHPAKEGDVREAVSKIEQLDFITSTGCCLSILDEHVEIIKGNQE